MELSQKVAHQMKSASWIRRMFEKGSELKARFGPENVFDFTLGNPMVEPPERFGEELRRAVLESPSGAHRYMSNNGYAETRQAVARHMSEESGVDISPDSVIMTVGAAGALNVALKAILNPGEEVMVIAPFFPEYMFYIENHGGRVRIVESNEDFSLNLDNIAGALGVNTKAIILNTPNNPTGVVYSGDTLEALAELLRQHKARTGRTVFVISDEPYRRIVYGMSKIPQSLRIFDDMIFCTSHSKDLALPGERIGYAIIGPKTTKRDELLAAMIFSNRILGFVNAPALMQRVVTHLQDVTVDVDDYKRKRDVFYAGLQEAGIETTLPGGAFYFFAKSPLDDDVEFIDKLFQKNILAVPGSGFGRSGYFRLSYCVDMETIRRALPVFKEVMTEL